MNDCTYTFSQLSVRIVIVMKKWDNERHLINFVREDVMCCEWRRLEVTSKSCWVRKARDLRNYHFSFFSVITEKLTCKLICSGFWLSWTLAPEFSMICLIVAPALPMIRPAVVFGTIILTLKLNLVSNISTLTIVNRPGCPWDLLCEFYCGITWNI